MTEASPNLPPPEEQPPQTPPDGSEATISFEQTPSQGPAGDAAVYDIPTEPVSSPGDPANAAMAEPQVNPERAGAGLVASAGIAISGLRRRLAGNKAMRQHGVATKYQRKLERNEALDKAARTAAEKTLDKISGEPSGFVVGSNYGKTNRTVHLGPHGYGRQPGGRPSLDLATLQGDGNGRHARRVKKINRAKIIHNEAGIRLRVYTELDNLDLLDEDGLNKILRKNKTLSWAQRRDIEAAGRRARRFAHERHEMVEELEDAAEGKSTSKLDRVRDKLHDRRIKGYEKKAAGAKRREKKAAGRLTANRKRLHERERTKERADASQAVRKQRRQLNGATNSKQRQERSNAGLDDRIAFHEDLGRVLGEVAEGREDARVTKDLKQRRAGRLRDAAIRRGASRQTALFRESTREGDEEKAAQHKEIIEGRAKEYTEHTRLSERRQAGAQKLQKRQDAEQAERARLRRVERELLNIQDRQARQTSRLR